MIALLVLVVGCSTSGVGSGIDSPSGETTEPAPSLAATVDWDRSEVPYGICPPNAVPADTIAFGEPVDTEFGGVGGVVRHGVVANEQGELFRIDVFGREDEFVAGYFRAPLQLCLDAVFTSETAEELPEGPDAGDVPPEGEFGLEDLIIQIALLGFVDPARDPGATAKEIAPNPVDDWAGILERLEATPEQALPEAISNAYIIDAVIDPGIGLTTHQYREITSNKILTTTTVSGGQVRPGLCRNSWNPLVKATASVGTPRTLSDTQSSSYSYDLAVKGLTSSNRYMLTASWGISGWSAGYWAPAPTGSQKVCYP